MNILENLKRRIQFMVSRAKVLSSNDKSGRQTLQIEIFKDEILPKVERIQEYGFTSKPKPGSEAVVLSVGGNRSTSLIIGTEDGRYRVKQLEDGEVCIYTDEGDQIYLKRGNQIAVKTKKLTIDAETEVTVNTVKANVNATSEVNVVTQKANIESPTGVDITTSSLKVTGTITCAGLAAGSGATPAAGKVVIQGQIEVSGNAQVGGNSTIQGNINANGQVSDGAGSMAGMRSTYNGHTHGSSPGPSPTM